MSVAHICDECKTVAPVGEAVGWWRLEAMDSLAGPLVTDYQKTEYNFCGWGCASTFLGRMTALERGETAA